MSPRTWSWAACPPQQTCSAVYLAGCPCSAPLPSIRWRWVKCSAGCRRPSASTPPSLAESSEGKTHFFITPEKNQNPCWFLGTHIYMYARPRNNLQKNRTLFALCGPRVFTIFELWKKRVVIAIVRARSSPEFLRSARKRVFSIALKDHVIFARAFSHRPHASLALVSAHIECEFAVAITSRQLHGCLARMRRQKGLRRRSDVSIFAIRHINSLLAAKWAIAVVICHLPIEARNSICHLFAIAPRT
jgi:hypothetical protein